MLKNYFTDEKYMEIKLSDNILYKALEIASTLFQGDVDKGGNSYMSHILYVYNNVNGMDEKMVALLHDVIEDKDVTSEDLLEIGIPEKIVFDVQMLTRVKPIEYNDYIDNIIRNGSVRALNVKLADLKNNMDISRIKTPTIKDYERVSRRYAPAYEKIINRLENINKKEI